MANAPAVAVLEQTRARTMALVGHLDAATLEAVHSPIMGPLVWDLAHIAAYEDLWLCHRYLGLDLLRGDLAALYDAFETPRPARQDAEAGLLNTEQALEYLTAVRARARGALGDADIADATLFELVVRHELQHTETMRQTMSIAGLLPEGEPPALTVGVGAGVVVHSNRHGSARAYTRTGNFPTAAPERDTIDGADNRDRAALEPGLRMVAVPEGTFVMGAGPDGFAYDNERPRHAVSVNAFQIAAHPLTNATWQRFCADGGYERREWWSEQGWTWLQAHRGLPDYETPTVDRADPDACLVHVCWFEAQALAAANDARLPSEAEWEKAAGGSLQDVGMVWEWTHTVFDGYPGFRAHPYREYSEVFFDGDYLVLRGHSWATGERVASATFRNWDLPQRRQIFAGVRLVRDC